MASVNLLCYWLNLKIFHHTLTTYLHCGQLITEPVEGVKFYQARQLVAVHVTKKIKTSELVINEFKVRRFLES